MAVVCNRYTAPAAPRGGEDLPAGTEDRRFAFFSSYRPFQIFSCLSRSFRVISMLFVWMDQLGNRFTD